VLSIIRNNAIRGVIMEIDQGFNEFISKHIALDDEGNRPTGYFRFTRGRNASSSRSCGVAKVEADGDPQEVAADLLNLIEKLVQEEYRSPQADRCNIYCQYVDRGATRHKDWCCVFDVGEVSDALSAVGGPLGADLAGRVCVGMVAELMRLNRDLHTRSMALLDSQCEMALSIGTGGSDMTDALEALQPTLQQVAASLPAIIAARSQSKQEAPAETVNTGTPQQRADNELQTIEASATRLASLIMTEGAKINSKNKKRLKDLAQVINQITA
jgi:hypothetical protein